MLLTFQLHLFPPSRLKSVPVFGNGLAYTPHQRLRHHYDTEEYLTNPDVYLFSPAQWIRQQL